MRQSRRMSVIEAIANVAVGFALAVLTQIIVFPIFGLQASLSDNLAIGLVFTTISLTVHTCCGDCSRRSGFVKRRR